MSYYQAHPSYYKDPGPRYCPDGDIGAPVPGWGALLRMAGPERIAVGQHGTGQFATERIAAAVTAKKEADAAAAAKFPWWLVPIGAVAVGTVVIVVGTKKGWL